MNRQIHGILSLVLIAAAVITALAAIFPSSLFWALIYITGILASSLIIVYSFCAKCPCRHTSCGHVLPGALTWFFPRREEGPYTLADTVGVVVPLVFMVVFPQVLAALPHRLFHSLRGILDPCCCGYPVFRLQGLCQYLLSLLPGWVWKKAGNGVIPVPAGSRFYVLWACSGFLSFTHAVIVFMRKLLIHLLGLHG